MSNNNLSIEQQSRIVSRKIKDMGRNYKSNISQQTFEFTISKEQFFVNELKLTNDSDKFCLKEYEESKVDNGYKLSVKKGSARIQFMAKALEERMFKKSKYCDFIRDDDILKIIMDKPICKKKNPRTKDKIKFHISEKKL